MNTAKENGSKIVEGYPKRFRADIVVKRTATIYKLMIGESEAS